MRARFKPNPFEDEPFPVLKSARGIPRVRGFRFGDKPSKRRRSPQQIDAGPHWRPWLGKWFPHVASAPMGQRHIELWDWFEGLERGVAPRARIAPWPRGGGKSTTIELAVVRLACKLTRRFVLIVCNTQEQADEHVNHIATRLEELGIERQVNKYGHSRGWKRDECRTEHGFVVAGYGLAGNARGIKKDEFRPDLIIFDDVDDVEDSPKTVAKKIRQITLKLLPAGSMDCGVAFVQNLIHENSVMSQLVEGKAEFILDRDITPVEPAIENFEYKKVDRGDGRMIYKITGGVPTWAGQTIEICESQINRFGIAAFLRESQQIVRGTDGHYFKHEEFGDAIALPLDLSGFKRVRAWDLAATHGGGDWTVGVLMFRSPAGIYYIVDVVRGQWSPEEVEKEILRAAKRDQEKYGGVRIRLPQDPAQAGKYQAVQLERMLSAYDVVSVPVSGTKAVNARGYAGQVNLGNVRLVQGEWNWVFKEEHRLFREDEEHEHDDQVDAGASAFNEIGEEQEWSAY